MIRVVLSIPEETMEAICKNYDYQEFLVNYDENHNKTEVPNPESKAVFMENRIKDYLEDHTLKFRKEEAIKLAEESINQEPINIT